MTKDSDANINKWAVNGRILWIFMKYQLVSKLIVALIAFPIFNVIFNILVRSSGRTNISSGDYMGFLFSIQGIPLIIISLLLLVVVLGMDINTFIIISSLVVEKKLDMNVKGILLSAFKSIKHFFSPIGLFIVVFISFVLPLLNIGIAVGPFKNFKIPNFITSVIFGNPLYNFAYNTIIAILLLISMIYIFSLHFIIIDGQGVPCALRNSRIMMARNWKKFIVDYIWMMVRITMLFVVIGFILIVALSLLSMVFKQMLLDNQYSLIIILFLSISEIVMLYVFVSGPISIFILTNLFYKYSAIYGEKVELKIAHTSKELSMEEMERKIKKKTKFKVVMVLVVMMLLNILISVVAVDGFDEFFKTDVNVELIAHRGGGDLGAENTLEGIEKAINEGVDWTEIDVQRTKDGKYIINHDVTFERCTDEPRTPSEMTLDEIKQLRVKNEFYPNEPSQEVATFEEILDLSKGKIGVFVELKGESADEKMVDDVVAMIKSKDMLDECVILSLDYAIIEYTVETHPDIKTGYLYYFSTGKLKDLQGDYLIMEEGVATPSNIYDIHAAGKKAVVWTVNTPESIQEFIYSDVDGIITDHIMDIKKAIKASKDRSPLEVIIDTFELGI